MLILILYWHDIYIYIYIYICMYPTNWFHHKKNPCKAKKNSYTDKKIFHGVQCRQKKSSFHRCLSGNKYCHQRFGEKNSYPNHITHSTPSSSMLWLFFKKIPLLSISEVNLPWSLTITWKTEKRVKHHILFSPVSETIICVSSEKYFPPTTNSTHTVWSLKFINSLIHSLKTELGIYITKIKL